MNQHTAIIGAQWGDEGKGKIVDFLMNTHDVVVRFQGGNNAGHTVVVGKESFPLHLIPSGILHSKKTCLIGDGVIVNPEVLVGELKSIQKRISRTAKLYLSKRSQVIMPWHIIRDGITGKKLGTTQRGIGPTYTDATGRQGIRVMDFTDTKRIKALIQENADLNSTIIEALLNHYQIKLTAEEKVLIKLATDAEKVTVDYLAQFKLLKKLGVELVDGSEFLNQRIANNKSILFEGAQATLLDIIHGDYPYVTSSHPTIGGVFIGTGCRPQDLRVIGVSKAYSTRVGEGPYPTELFDKTADKLRDKGHEFGTTTGRPRRCGWLDLVALKYSVQVNGMDAIAVTKLDVMGGLETIRVAVAYKLGAKQFNHYPAETWLREKAKPIYQEFKGWQEDISKARKFADLPVTTQKYLKFIEKQIGVPVKFIGVGPDRSELIDL